MRVMPSRATVSVTATSPYPACSVHCAPPSKLDNAGFNLWRSEVADGEYTKLNPSLIPARGNPDTGTSYQYAGAAVVKGMTYFYKLEDVDLHGLSTFHGPVSATLSPIRRIWLPCVVN